VLDRADADLTLGLLDAIDESTSVVCVSAVQYATGSRVDVSAVVDRAPDVGARVIIDATQLAGAAPLSVRAWGADAVVCSGYKWLSAHGGVALLSLAPELASKLPRLIGWKGARAPFTFEPMTLRLADDACRFELPTISYASAIGLHTSILMLSEVDPGRAEVHAQKLAAELVAKVEPLGWSPFRPLSDPSASSHIVALRHPSVAAIKIQRKLADDHNVFCSRNEAIRNSLHVYNDLPDIDRLVRCLAEVTANEAQAESGT
jgi:cysteine desulfurase/selenocysteine lyase